MPRHSMGLAYAPYIDPSGTTPGLIGSPMAVPWVVSGYIYSETVPYSRNELPPSHRLLTLRGQLNEVLVQSMGAHGMASEKNGCSDLYTLANVDS